MDFSDFFLDFLDFWDFLLDFFGTFVFFLKLLRLQLETKIALNSAKRHKNLFFCPKGKKNPRPKAKALLRS